MMSKYTACLKGSFVGRVLDGVTIADDLVKNSDPSSFRRSSTDPLEELMVLITIAKARTERREPLLDELVGRVSLCKLLYGLVEPRQSS